MAPFKWTDGGKVPLVAAGKRLEGQCFGPGPHAAPIFVLLHEGLGCLALWRDFPAKLSQLTGFGVFAWSRAGYGQSDAADVPRPLDYMSREAMESLPEVLDAIGFRRGILLGHSDGASIAAIYCGGVVDFRVRGLMLIAPHFFTEPGGLKSIRQARKAYESGDLKDKLAKYHSNPDNAFYGWNDAWLAPGFKDWNIADAIDYWRIPVLAIQGAADPYGSLAQIDEIRNRIYSPLEVGILENCGHAPQFEQPQRTLGAIADFARRLERIEKAEVKIRRSMTIAAQGRGHER